MYPPIQLVLDPTSATSGEAAKPLVLSLIGLPVFLVMDVNHLEEKSGALHAPLILVVSSQ